MTKMVRIENADTSTVQVIVEVWMKDQWNRDVLDSTFQLNNPTDMIYTPIHRGRWLVVREVSEQDNAQ